MYNTVHSVSSEDPKKPYEIYKRFDGRFNIAQGGLNPMPGATGGFSSVEDAKLALRVLIHVAGRNRSGQDWWSLYHRVTGVTQQSREDSQRRAEALGMRRIKTGKNTYTWTPKGNQHAI